MITHVQVYDRLKALLESCGYRITSWQWKSPLTATHSALGDIEIYFFGENFRVDDNASPFPAHKRTRSEAMQDWQTERTMMSEEAGHVCSAKAVLLAVTKLATRQNGKRIGLAFPDTHNFMKHLEPVVIPLSKAGIEFFFITSTLEVAAIGKQWTQLPPCEGGGLLGQ